MKQLNRKTAIIGAAAVIAVIAALVTALYFTLWMGPSKQDFSDAKAKADKIKTYNGSTLLTDYARIINTERRAGTTGDELINAGSAEKKKVLDAINSRAELAEQISKSRVVRDESVKKVFDTYYAQEQKYDAYIEGYANVYAYYISSFGTCVKAFQINDAAGTDLTKYAGLHRTAAKPCLQDLSTVAKSSITPLANYAKEFTRIINERQKVFDGLEKKTLDSKAASDRIKELGNDYSKNDPVEALQKFVKEAGFDGELNKLIDTLDEKAKASE